MERNPDGTFAEGNSQGKKFVKGDERCDKRGRAKGSQNLTTIVKRMLDEEFDTTDPFAGNKVKRKAGDIIVAQTVAKACHGDLNATKLIWERTEGKPTQPIDLDSTGELNINWGVDKVAED